MWYIIRHGETFVNVKKSIVQGHTKNIFLTFNGILQAYVNGTKLRNTKEDFTKYRIICSPLERAINTCQIIMDEIDRNGNPEYEELMMERCQGIFDGIMRDKISEIYPEEFKITKENPWNCEFEGYENYKTIFKKINNFIDKYKNEKNLIIVAHEGTNQCLMYLLQKKENKDILSKWIDSLSDEDGSKIIKEIKKIDFDQNYFYSWDGTNMVKI